MTRYTRADWGARAPRGGPGSLQLSRVEGIALHWPAMSKPLTTVAAVMAALRSWQAYHMDTHGWSDIGYQVAVDQQGNRYELRGITTQSGANGDTDVNERFGAVLLVLAPGEQPTEAMMRETRAVVADHRALFPKSRRVVGHGQIRPGGTTCPGPITQGLIDRGAFEPQSEPQPQSKPEPEDDMPTPRDLLNEPLNANDPKGRQATQNVTVGEALTAFVVFLRYGQDAARKYLDDVGQLPAKKG
jgi:hypothetical protein